ncbi:hypothetical protein A374_17184 [Fictibacillus macauensis ZFHKF-1]|uniref:Uncharacterized protein n=1 Tax=Fictibacillus macauensis ZFHKF-1 TaxID=1196324 RepID=I8AEK9_9BACL|nr:hypothetical protein [Fictibacillus macauensis]EIT84012.1 hypothetical protein A374_17184 [Fictibacillus macauensis ZFHKF-1]
MLAVMLSLHEAKEVEYVLKQELESLLYDLQDESVNADVKAILSEQYQCLFNVYTRFAAPSDCMKFCRRKRSN